MRILKHTFLIFIFITIVSDNILAQQKGAIYGKVSEVLTNQPVIGANVILLGTNLGAATNINGEFKIENIPFDTYRLKVSAVGFTPVTKTDIVVASVKPVQVDFELKQTVIQLEGVTVKSDYFSNDPLQFNSTKNFSYEEIRRAPGSFEDVVRALSVLPGVAQADPGRNDLIVRGGAPSENLFIVDGITVPNINHFGTQGATGGPLSFINLDYVKGTSFSTGGFPALYGDKLSSVLSINLRDGRQDRIGGKATVSATQFGLNLEGPVSSSSDFIFSARRSYLDFVFKAAGFGFVPEYYDVLTKANFKLNNKNTLSFLFISAFDNVRYFNNTADQRYKNSRVLGSDQVQYVTGFTYKSLFDNGYLTASLSRNYTDYNTSQKDSLLNPIFMNKSLEAANTLRTDLVYKLSSSSEINLGGEVSAVKFKANILFPPFSTSFGYKLPDLKLATLKNYTKAAVYSNFNFTPFQRMTANLGIRLDYFDPIENKFYVSPRFSASYQLSGLTEVNFSTGIYYQSPSYIWLAANDLNKNLKSIRADQYILGIDHRLREDTQLKIEGFYKIYKDYPASLLRPYLVLANTGAGFSGATDNFSSFGLEPLVSEGRGTAKGVELSVQKKLSDIPFYGLLSLTYSKTDFVSLDGIERPGSFDQRWLFNISGGYIIDRSWETSFKFRYATGRPYTPFSADGSQNIDAFNSVRFGPFHSLDLRVDKKWFFNDWTLITYVDIQNIYNHINRTTIRWDDRTNSIEENSSIGILPSIGISAEF